MGGEFTYQPKWDPKTVLTELPWVVHLPQNGFDNHSHIPKEFLRARFSLLAESSPGRVGSRAGVPLPATDSRYYGLPIGEKTLFLFSSVGFKGKQFHYLKHVFF